MRKLLATTVLIILMSIPVSAQYLYSIDDGKGKLDFHVDCASFKTDQEDVVRLEVYYKVFNKYLAFEHLEGRFQAVYEVTFTIFDNKNRQTDGYNRRIDFNVPTYEKTLSDDDFRTSAANFKIKPGKYKIECRLDDMAAGKSVEKTIKFNVRDFNKKYSSVSDIEFVYAVDSASPGSPFNKEDWTIVPSVIRSYGGDSIAPMVYYYEIYRGKDKRDKVFIETRILNQKLDAVYFDSLTAEFTDETIRQIRHINLRGISSGQYFLDVTLFGRRKKQIDNIRTPFKLSWSPETMIVHDYEGALRFLKYIASSGEVKEMKKATDLNERLRLWEEFWRQHDPTPGTEVNEAKRDYYRRIELANQYFGLMGREGWLTDRGRIFIQFGEPDQMEDNPFESEQKAYQVWYYYHLSIQRRFVFVDNWGDGDYRLQYPYDGIIR